MEGGMESDIRLTCCCFPCQECKALCKEVDSKEALDCHLRGRNSFSPTFGWHDSLEKPGVFCWFLLFQLLGNWWFGLLCYWWFTTGPQKPPNHRFSLFEKLRSETVACCFQSSVVLAGERIKHQQLAGLKSSKHTIFLTKKTQKWRKV